MPVGLGHDLLLVVRRGVIEDFVRALLLHERLAALGARRAEDAKPGGARHLHGGDADGAARAVNQHGLARLRAALVEQRAPRGDVGNVHAGALRERRWPVGR